MITILIPIKEYNAAFTKFLIGNKKILEKYPLIVVSMCRVLELEDLPKCTFIISGEHFWEARRIGLREVKTKYVLNLDADTVLPDEYIERVLGWLENCPKVGIVSLNYQQPNGQDHAAFGTSIMRTEDMKKLYDYNPKKYGVPDGDPCECKYMYAKILNADLGTVVLDLFAIHLKGKFL